MLNTTDSGERKDISYVQFKETSLDTRGLEEPVNASRGRKKGKASKRMTGKDVWEKVVGSADTAWNLFMSVNFIFSIVIMMVRLYFCTDIELTTVWLEKT